MSINSNLAQQGILILDGGLATELEHRGAHLQSELWSARMLIENPDLIRAVHHDFMVAGADVVISASYQASIFGFMKAGLSSRKATELIELSTRLACEARDAFCASSDFHNRLRPLVAASIGPYGACLADGSEYHGIYGKTKTELIDFHRPRMEILNGSTADLLAFETIPSLLEAEALLELLNEFPEVKAWLSFSCKDEKHVSHGENFTDCVALVSEHPQIEAIGVNCTRPEHVSGLLRKAAHCNKPLMAYPNSGESWNTKTRSWTGEGGSFDVKDWVEAGARLIGGCCRVSPAQISQLRDSLIDNPA